MNEPSATFRKPVHVCRVGAARRVLTMAADRAQLDECVPRPRDGCDLYPVARAVKVMSLGYTACRLRFWTRAVHTSRHHVLRSAIGLLPKLLDLTVSLDPHLLPA